MNIINTALGIPLGYIIYTAYRLTNSYGLAILIFAVVTRVIIFPVNALAHRNAIRLLRLQPSLTTVKRRYAGDQERLYEEQHALFKKEGYSPYLGLIPLFVQLVLIVGIMQVMYNPLQHLLHFENDVIDALVQAAREMYGIQGGYGEQLRVIEAFRQPENLHVFRSALACFLEADRILYAAAGVDLNFLCLNLGEIPSLANPSIILVVPFLSGVTALMYCLTQSAMSPGALSQGKRTNYGLTAFTVVFSLYFALVTPAGVGLYWAAGNLLSIAVVLILDVLYSPKKLAREALSQIIAGRKTQAKLKEERQLNKALRIREKQDLACFQTASKQIVFYAISSGQYKYYKNIIEYLLERSGIIIHYLTNDPEDALFEHRTERLIPYYASQKKAISLMMRLDTDIVVTTVPDLQSFYIKRSVVRDDIEYIYIPHGLTSTHFAIRESAYDNFDTVFCVGPHQVAEVRRREELASLPRKKMVKAGYGVYDQMTASYEAISHISNDKPRVLIAPSWQDGNIMELCIDAMLEALLGKGFDIVVRPHPQYIRIFPEHINALMERYSNNIDDREIVFELDFLGNESIYRSDILITDWSSIALEFSYCTLKPSVFVNTPMKVMNPNYEQYGLEVLDISLRDRVGVSLDLAELERLDVTVSKLLAEKDAFKADIEQIVSQYLFYPNRNGEAGGLYILNQLGAKLLV